jgi:hypothetical protein
MPPVPIFPAAGRVARVHHPRGFDMRRLLSAVRAALAAILVSAAPLAAQLVTSGEGPLRSSGALTLGPVIGVNLPVGSFSDVAGTGFTIGGQATYGLGVATLLGEVSYSSFTGKNNLGSRGTVAYAAGARVGLSLAGLYAGGVAGFWTDDVDEFDIVPLVGVHLGPLDLNARFKGIFGDADWFAFGGAVHFRLK